MKATVGKLRKENEELRAELRELKNVVEDILTENKLLRSEKQILLRRLFGRKSEQLDDRQLDLLAVEQTEIPIPDKTQSAPTGSPGTRKRRKSRPRLPEDLPTEEHIIDPDEVRATPEWFRCIGEEVTPELGMIPVQYFLRLWRRRKFVDIRDRDRAPLIGALPPRVIEGGYASPELLADITTKKYIEHTPLYRQEQILKNRYGIEISRKTLTDWVRVVADWLKPIYNHIRADLKKTGYLQIDESPVTYCKAEGGGSGQGYLWVYNNPGTDVLYEWHRSRAADCLDDMLKEFEGVVQCDGYSAYTSYAKGREGISLAACWAHSRRKFHEALEEEPALAGWFIRQIRHLYRIEKRLRKKKAGPDLRQAVRASESAMILDRMERALKLKMGKHLPRSQMGKAISYTLSLWPQLLRYVQDGRVEIDNNLVENAIRPTALGKKNYLFFGAPDAGERSAVIYTILETCRRHGINPYDYLQDVLTRLPAMKITEVDQLTPANWAAKRKAA
jgi:transposase